MGRLKGPAFLKDYDFEKWEKLVRNWIRTVPRATGNSEIVAALIGGLSEQNTREGALDAVIELDDTVLYAEEGELEELPKLEETPANPELTAAEKKVIADKLKQKKELDESKGTRPAERYIHGIELILSTLQKKYGMTKDRRIFSYWEQFATLSRPTDMSLSDFACRFESSYRRLQNAGVTIHEAILSYMLLKGATLNETYEKLARTNAASMTFEHMRESLERLGDDLTPNKKASKLIVRPTTEPIEVLYQQEEDISEEDIYDSSNQEEDDENNVYYYRQKSFRGKKYYGGRGRSQPNSNQYRRQNSKSEDRNGKKTGRVSRCAICDSKYHWAPECPHKDPDHRHLNKAENILKVDAVLPDNEHWSYITQEANNLALIDSGATKTVVGKKWMTQYEEGLDEKDKDMIKEEKHVSVFKFGDGKSFHSDTVKIIPTVLCEQDVLIKASVVDADVPMLISRNTLRRAKATLDFEHDKLEMNSVKQDLFSTQSGHYAVPIGPNIQNLSYPNTDQHDVYLVKDGDDPTQIANKIHKYFAHANPDRLIEFVKTSNHEKKSEICSELKKIDCTWCKKHKREAPKPKTCLPLADKFNQTVAMDLKFLDSKEIVLHCIDLLTRFSTAIIIPDKTQETIVENFCKSWVAIFGRPEQTLVDNGREFCNQDLTDLCQNLMININTTAAFSPWSNGVVERHNGLLAEMIYKIKEDVNCNSTIALCWAVNAKNNMTSVYGFSPQQLVFGTNSPLPGLDAEKVKLSQLNNSTASKIVADNINAMFGAREAFLKAQNSDRLKRALRDRVVTAYQKQYYAGDKVYYRTNDTTWKPGIVIGQYKKLILVKTGGLFVRVHPAKMTLQTDADEAIARTKETDTQIPRIENLEATEKEVQQTVEESDEESEDEDHYNKTLSQLPAIEEEKKTEENEEEEEDNETTVWQKVSCDEQKGRFILRQGDTIRYKTDATTPMSRATVSGPAGTTKGKNKNRYNIEHEDGNKISIFADKLDTIERAVDQETVNIVSEERTDGSITFYTKPTSAIIQEIEDAKQKEIDNFGRFGVYEEIGEEEIPEDALIISSVWITQRKSNGLLKARLVARGFEESELDLKVDAPTVDKLSIRLFLSCVSMMEWKNGSLDVKAAFLQSHTLDRSVYLIPPKDIQKDGILWLIKKPMYGLKDSAKNWFKTVESELQKLGCQQSILDPSVFTYRNTSNELLGIFVCHVDDFLFSIGSESFNNNIISKIKQAYAISSENSVDFTYVGLKIQENENGISISQPEFAKYVQTVDLNGLKLRREDKLDKKLKREYQSLLGQLGWLAHQTRPDLSFNTFTCSLFQVEPSLGNLKDLNKIVGMVQNGPTHIQLSRLDRNSLKIVCFSDASFANVLPDKIYSGEGNLIFLADNSGKCALVNWKARKITRVVHSTQSAECLSLVEAIGDSCYTRSLLEEILFNNPRSKTIPIEVYVDSSQLFKAIGSTHMITDKLRRLNIAELKQLIHPESEKISLYWIPTDLMLSDCLTKIGASREKLSQVMMTGTLNQTELTERRACLKM